jgi:uncharacterized repeat protein (TIGR01451 family)
VDYFECNLAGANFSGADLSGADFQGATVTGANLQGANLTDTILTGANFTGSDFTDADLASSYGPRAVFTNAIFTDTDLDGDTFTSANFSGATFSGATFSGTILQAADLAGAQLSAADLAGVSGQATGTPASLPVGWTFFNGYLIGAGADLRRAALSGDNMPGINLSGAIVTEAKFTGDDLTGAIFTGATVEDTGFEDGNLTDADFSNDNLDGSNLTGADLSGTEFVDANLQNATFTGTTGDATTDVTGVTWLDTTCPDGTNSNEDNDTCLGHGFYSPLLLSKSTTSTGYAAAGQTIPYSYLVTNTGTLTMTGVAVTDDKNSVSCPSGTLTPGTNETCTGSYTVTQGDVDAGSVTNTATASASDSEGLVTSAPSSVTVSASSANSSISLTKSTTSTGYGAAGQTIPYSYLVTNTGTTTLTGVGVSDDLVPTVSCPSGTLAAGVAETCTGTYTVTQGDVDAGSVTNVATASGTNPQSTVVTSSPSSVTVAANSASSSISLTKSTTSSGYGAAGQTIPYSYLVTNTGTTTLTGVGVSDDLVPTVSCPSGTLAPGVAETCTGTYTVTQGDVDAGSVTNVATAGATNPQSLVIASSPSSVTVAAAKCNPPAITSASSATAVVGSTFHFTVTTCSTAVPRIRAFDLPQGLRLVDNHNGTATISGTPWVKNLSQQSATIRAIVKGQTKANQVFVFTLDQAPTFKSNAKYLAMAGVTFAYPVTTVHGYPVPTLTASNLPVGVTLTDNHNGTASLTGTPGPTAGGVYPITITATNGVGSPVNQAFVLTVYQAPVITSAASDTVAAGVVMTPFTVTDTGYPAPTLRASGLPSGVRLNAGTIEGTPKAKAAGPYPVTITATSRAGTATQNFELTVTP